MSNTYHRPQIALNANQFLEHIGNHLDDDELPVQLVGFIDRATERLRQVYGEYGIATAALLYAFSVVGAYGHERLGQAGQDAIDKATAMLDLIDHHADRGLPLEEMVHGMHGSYMAMSPDSGEQDITELVETVLFGNPPSSIPDQEEQ